MEHDTVKHAKEKNGVNQTIAIVTGAKSYFPVSIKEKLEHLNYVINPVFADNDAIREIFKPFCGIIIFADEKLVSETQTLNYIKERAQTEDIPIFAVGTIDELKTVRIVISKEHINREFPRPFSVNALVRTVHEVIGEFNEIITKKILVVDDSGAVLRSVKQWLGNKYRVHLANSAAMAIKSIALNRPDLILLDYEMPVVDGRQFIEILKSEPEFKDIPVVFLTAKEDKRQFMKVQAFKPEGYLLKSMGPGQIVKAIDDFFSR
ncbi:MAG: response regulator [Clostridiales bacterium]|jgi:CheY-like chemotaxis protein|nr:response regulator [Clostridiales bacterium]